MNAPDLAERYADTAEALDDLRQGFLMVPAPGGRSPAQLPPPPGPAPRRFPGIHFKEPRGGRSLLTTACFAAPLPAFTLVLPLAAAGTGAIAWVILGGHLAVAAVAMGGSRVHKLLAELRFLRRAAYTLGEVTRTFLAGNTGVALQRAHLAYRYPVGGQWHQGHLTTCRSRAGRRRGG